MDSMIFKAAQIEESLSSKMKLKQLTRMAASHEELNRDFSVINLSKSILASADISKSRGDLHDSLSPLNIASTP